MQRRSFVALLALALAAPLAPVTAHADMQAPTPPPVDVRGEDSTHGASGAPQSATWTIHNRGSSTTHVRVTSAVCLVSGMRLPLRITGVRVDGRDAVREFDVPAGGTVRVTAQLDGFSGPAEQAPSWQIELSADTSGAEAGRVRGVATVRRALARTVAR